MINYFPITYKVKKESEKTKLKVWIQSEEDCDIIGGDYKVFILNIVNGFIGNGDFELVQEYVDNNIEEIEKLMNNEHICVVIDLIEGGEWQGFEYVKWFEKVEIKHE